MNLFESLNKGFDRKYGRLVESDETSVAKPAVDAEKECDKPGCKKKVVKQGAVQECEDKPVINKAALRAAPKTHKAVVAKKEVEEGCDKGKKALKEAPIYGLEPQYDARQSFGGKAQVDVKKNGDEILYSYSTPVCKIDASGKVTLYPRWDESMTTLRHVKEFLLQHGKRAESKKQIATAYEIADEFIDEGCDKSVKGAKVPVMKEGCKDKKVSPIKEYKDMGQDLGEYQKWVDYDMKKYHKISDKTMKEIKDAGLSVVKDQYGDYEVIAHEKIREAIDKKRRVRAAAQRVVESKKSNSNDKANKVIVEAIDRVKARKEKRRKIDEAVKRGLAKKNSEK